MEKTCSVRIIFQYDLSHKSDKPERIYLTQAMQYKVNEKAFKEIPAMFSSRTGWRGATPASERDHLLKSFNGYAFPTVGLKWTFR